MDLALPRHATHDGDMTTTAPLPVQQRDDANARSLLTVDAILTGVNGVGYLALAGVLDDVFGVPSSLLITLGILLVIVAAGVAYLGTRRPIPKRWLRALASFNFAWVAASIAFVVVADLTTMGVAWTLLQAAIVAAFAARQVQLAQRL